MLKNHRLLTRSSIIAGLIVLNCFCCLIFRTRLGDVVSVSPSPIISPIDSNQIHTLLSYNKIRFSWIY
jgi:hypothetical protein